MHPSAKIFPHGKRGGKNYDLELIDELPDDYYMIFDNQQELKEQLKIFTKLLLNGADNWQQYSYYGNAYCYDEEIACALCNPSEYRITKGGEKQPYTEALEFVLHALKITQEGEKIAMLLRLQFLEGSKRYLKLFKTDPPKYVYLFVKRQKCFKNGISEPVGGSAVAYAWFVWLKGSKTEPILRWLN